MQYRLPSSPSREKWKPWALTVQPAIMVVGQLCEEKQSMLIPETWYDGKTLLQIILIIQQSHDWIRVYLLETSSSISK